MKDEHTPKERLEPVSTALPPSLVEHIRTSARERQWSMSQAIRHYVALGVKVEQEKDSVSPCFQV